MHIRKQLEPYLFLLPVSLLLLIINIYPILYVIYSSVHIMRPGSAPIFVGFENFTFLFGLSSWWRTVQTTMIWTISVLVPTVSISLGVALATAVKIKGGDLLRSFVMLPWMLPFVAISILFQFLFSSHIGLFGYFLNQLGVVVEGGVFSTMPLAAITLVIVQIWRTYPFMMVMLLAGLNSISPILYESAILDGANIWGRFRYITLPSIRSVALPGILLLTIGLINSFGFTYMLTAGGPGGATEIAGLFIYRTVMLDGDYGLGGAASIILLSITISLSLVYFYFYEKGL